MSLSSTTLQPSENISQAQATTKPMMGGGEITTLLGALMLSIYAGQKSRKQLRKIKRQMTWLLIKQKIQNAFKPAAVSDRRTLIIILIAVLVVALVLIEPLAALVLALIGLILLLAGVI